MNKLISLTLSGLMLTSLAANAVPTYKRLTPACVECTQIDNLLNKLNDEQGSNNKRLDIVFAIAKVITSLNLSTFNPDEQKRRIYFSLHGCVETLDDDYDSETVVRLIALRKQAPPVFDYVFNRLPLSDQKRIANRAQGLIKMKFVKGEAPPVKEIAE